MKILITSESYYPNVSGVAVFSHLLSSNLQKRGHQVFIITPGLKNQPKIKLEKEGKVTIFRLKSVYNPFRKGYRFTVLPYLAVKKIITEVSPDIVHMQDPSPISLCALFISRKKIPITITNHFSLDYVLAYFKLPQFLKNYLAKFLTSYLRWFYNQARILTCPTVTTKKSLLNLGIKSPIVPISNGVDLEQFFPYYPKTDLRKKFKIPLNLPVVLYVGRFDKDKQVEVLISAIEKVLNKKEIFFILCGNGKQKRKYLDLINDLDLKKNTLVIGFLKHKDEMPKIYQLADVFATASPIETQGIVVLEAMASGLPIVGPNGGALPEAIKNDQNGYLFKVGNSDDLALKILTILEDENLRTQMGKESLKLVEKHEISQTFDKFERIYQECLSK